MVLASVLLLAMAGIGAVADAPSQDDAGTGGDAGDSPSNATLVDPGSYEGNLTPPSKDADWYEVETGNTSKGCASVSFHGNAVAEAHLMFPQSDAFHASAKLLPSRNVSLGLAAPDLPGVLLGLNQSTGAAAGSYSFSTEIDPLMGTDEDQWADSRTEADEVPGVCVDGSVNTIGDEDWFHIHSDGNDTLVLSHTAFLDAPVDLIDPDGNVVVEDLQGGVETVDLDEPGEWLLRVDGTASSNYALGISLDPGEEEEEKRPCQPHCMS